MNKTIHGPSFLLRFILRSSSFILSSMRLYLLRHAEAADRAPSDAARELTPLGIEQAQTVGAFCKRHSLKPNLILTSPFRRAVQTAQLVAAPLGLTAQTAAFLASGMDPENALMELGAYQQFAAVMIVGHQPDLGLLATRLLGLRNDETLPVDKASLICLETNRLALGAASLHFFLPVKLMG